MTDTQKSVIQNAVNEYIKYCVNGDKDTIDPKELKIQEIVEGHLYDVLCMFYNTGNPDPKIQESLDNGKFDTPKKVIEYIELTT